MSAAPWFGPASRCPLCGNGRETCACRPRDLYQWAARQTSLPGLDVRATETAEAWLANRDPRGRGRLDARQRALF